MRLLMTGVMEPWWWSYMMSWQIALVVCLMEEGVPRILGQDPSVS